MKNTDRIVDSFCDFHTFDLSMFWSGGDEVITEMCSTRSQTSSFADLLPTTMRWCSKPQQMSRFKRNRTGWTPMWSHGWHVCLTSGVTWCSRCLVWLLKSDGRIFVGFFTSESSDLIPRLASVDLQGCAVHWSRFLGNLLLFSYGLWNEDLMWLLAASRMRLHFSETRWRHWLTARLKDVSLDKHSACVVLSWAVLHPFWERRIG